MKKIAIGSAVALASAVLVAAPAQAGPGQSAAIAISQAATVYGWANYIDGGHQVAESAAIGSCVQQGGTDCVLAAWVTDGCASLIVDADDDWAGGSGPTADAAIEDAYSRALAGGLTLDQTPPATTICTY